jgi:endonuclease YncB( thermonuclease family)
VKKSTISGIVVIIAVIGILSYFYPIEENTINEIPKETTPVPNIEEKFHTESEISCGVNALCYIGIVERVVDGDTLDIDGQRIRLSLTNTPERDQQGFSDATAFTKSLCPVVLWHR